MKSYEIIKKTKIDSDGTEYNVFYIKKKVFGMMYRITNFGGTNYGGTYYDPFYDVFLLLSLIANSVFLLFNILMRFESDNAINVPYGYWFNLGLAVVTTFLHYALFPIRFKNIDNAKEYITRSIKIKNFKSTTTKVSKYIIDLEYFEEKNRQDKIKSLNL